MDTADKVALGLAGAGAIGLIGGGLVLAAQPKPFDPSSCSVCDTAAAGMILGAAAVGAAVGTAVGARVGGVAGAVLGVVAGAILGPMGLVTVAQIAPERGIG